MELTAAQIESITKQPTPTEALQICGQITPYNAQPVRLAYIRAIMGSRATGGFFTATRANVNANFLKAWEHARSK